MLAVVTTCIVCALDASSERLEDLVEDQTEVISGTRRRSFATSQ
jgi:hypothetical protein